MKKKTKKDEFYDVEKLKGIFKSIVAFSVIVMSFVYCEYYFISSDNFTDKGYTSSIKANAISLDIGESINLANYIANVDQIKYLSFKNENIFELDYEYNVMSVQEGDDELKILYKDNSDETLYFTTRVDTSNAEYTNGKFIKSSIRLNNQGATNPGANKIYMAYFKNDKASANFFIDAKYTKNMTANRNKINTPSKTGYVFKGYYTGKNGKGLRVITEEGYIVSNVKLETTKLYAYWQK